MDENELDNIEEEGDVISDPVENLPQYDAYNPSGRGKKKDPPKNPAPLEASIVVAILGILPDAIDFFSIGGLSFLSSILSWPVTELYFFHKNLKVPNVKSWMRWLNIGDAVPFLGALPLKTIGLIMAIYIAWHPKSKLAKAVKVADTVTNIKKPSGTTVKDTTAKPGSSLKEITSNPKERKSLPELSEDGLTTKEKDLYETTSAGGAEIQSPEAEAQTADFKEIAGEDPIEESVTATPAPEKKETEIKLADKKPGAVSFEDSVDKEEGNTDEEINERLGIGAVERDIQNKLTSPEAVMESFSSAGETLFSGTENEEAENLNPEANEVAVSDNEKVVDFSQSKQRRQKQSQDSNIDGVEEFKKAA